MSFVHLHSHTQYSIKDALNKIPAYVARVKELGQTACAITDHGVMYGVIEFYHACQKAGIKPILGCEVYVAPDGDSRLVKRKEDRYDHLVLLAKDLKGYYNLMQIVTEGCVGEGFYYKPRIDDETLEKYHEGLIALSACLAGRVPKYIVRNEYDKAKDWAKKYQSLFGEGNYYLELQDHGIPEQRIVNSGLLRIHTETGIPIVATNDCHYTNKEDVEAHNILLCMSEEVPMGSQKHKDELGQWYVKSEEEMRSLFPSIPEAIENTQKVADMCNVVLPFHETKMPKFPLPEDETAKSYLRKLCQKGFDEKYADKTAEEKKRLSEKLDHQLSVIEEMGFTEYFLIVQDYCNWAKENGVSVGPGRGCLAGDTMVLTQDGFKKISKVSIADKVYSHTGRLRTVENVFTYPCNEEMVNISTATGGVTMTPDHRVYVIRKEHRRLCKPEWVQARTVRKDDLVLTPIVEGITRRFIEKNAPLEADDKYIYQKVTEVTQIASVKKVYDIQVEEDHSFLADNYIVHNSAAGSIVTYCLNITSVNPEAFDLQFERFLNPERVSMPDIDVDFDVNGRKKVVDHCRELYGNDNVVQIITFICMETKAVVKDVGKVLGYEYAFRDGLTKLIPKEAKSLREAIDMSPDLKDRYANDPDAKKLLDRALTLEGLPKSISTHAAGVIISDIPTSEYIPLTKSVDGTGVVSQYTMTYVEELGLLKMDFLGLRTLTVIKDCLKNIEQNRNVINVDVDYTDKDVWKFIGTGKTTGVFQLESAGMQKFMRDLRPTNIEDLVAGVSLYRPGPMDFIPAYIENKNNPSQIRYEVPELEPILKNTYGCIVYQEQVTQIVRDLAGYSMGAADNIRRAMSKKKQEVIDGERQTFVYGNGTIPGCVNKGISEESANKIYDHMIDFAKYAFNKSHAACYAIISYQTAYLRYYYPAEYFAAVATSFISKADKLAMYLEFAKEVGIKIAPPDINISTAEFVSKDNSIVFALCGVKGISEDSARIIVEEREKGPFKNLADALDRLSRLKITKAAIINLINAGAFDGFEGNRAQKAAAVEPYLSGKKKDKNQVEGQITLFDIADIPTITLPDIPEYDNKLSKEKESTGVYISGHPLNRMRSLIKHYSNVNTMMFELEDGTYEVRDKQQVKMVCMVTEIKRHYTKKGDRMAFVTIEDLYGRADVVIFPTLYNVTSIKEDQIIMLEGKVSIDSEKGLSIIAENIIDAENSPKTLWLRFEDMRAYEDKLTSLDKCVWLEGKDFVSVYLVNEKRVKTIHENVTISEDNFNNLTALLGEKNVALG